MHSVGHKNTLDCWLQQGAVATAQPLLDELFGSFMVPSDDSRTWLPPSTAVHESLNMPIDHRIDEIDSYEADTDIIVRLYNIRSMVGIFCAFENVAFK